MCEKNTKNGEIACFVKTRKPPYIMRDSTRKGKKRKRKNKTLCEAYRICNYVNKLDNTNCNIGDFQAKFQNGSD